MFDLYLRMQVCNFFVLRFFFLLLFSSVLFLVLLSITQSLSVFLDVCLSLFLSLSSSLFLSLSFFLFLSLLLSVSLFVSLLLHPSLSVSLSWRWTNPVPHEIEFWTVVFSFKNSFFYFQIFRYDLARHVNK